MGKSIKRKLMAAASCALSAVMCFGALVACGDDTATSDKAEHIAAVPATCYALGNKEYWTKGGKYYSDAACKNEITQADTVVPKRSHDFITSTTYGHDEQGHHWKVCAYEDCDGKGTQENHNFEEGPTCVCGVEYSGTYTLTIDTSIEHATVTANKTTNISAGETITITVTNIDEGYELNKLKYTTNGTQYVDISMTSKQFEMPKANVTVTAEFVKTVYTVTADSEVEGGTITVDKQTATVSDTVTVTATPDSGYEVETLKYNDGTDHNITGTTFTMPAHDVTVTGTFRLITEKFGVTIDTAIANGSVTADKAEYAEGDTVTLTVTADEGYHIKSVSYNDGESDVTVEEEEGEYTFEMPAKAVTVTAEFEAHDYSGGENGGECSCGETNGFQYFYLGNGSSHVERTDTANSVKIKRTDTGSLNDYDIHLDRGFGVKVGHYYQITYKFKSNKAGKIGVWIGDVTFQDDSKRFIENFATGEEIVFSFGFVPTKASITTEFQMGLLPEGFEVEITDFSLEEVVGNFIDGWKFKVGGDASKGSDMPTEDDMAKYNDDGSFTVTGTGNGNLWDMKIEKDITLIANHNYELIVVFNITGNKTNENAEFSVYEGKFAEKDGEFANKACWMDHQGMFVKTFKFKATDSITIGSCFAFGNISDAEHPIAITFYHINLVDLGVAN